MRSNGSKLPSSAGEFPESITHSLPGVVNPGIHVYGLKADVHAADNEPDIDKYKESKPFIKF